MADIKILPMGENHIKEIANIEKECFSKPWSEKALQEELQNTVANFLVAVKDEKVVGYIGVHIMSEESFIANLAVLEEYRQQGIARTLLQTAQGMSFGMGAKFISLEVRKSNTIAIDLYKSEDFKIAGKRKNFYSNPQEDAVILTMIF